MDINHLKYPIGEHKLTVSPSKAQLNQWIEDISSFPNSIEKLVSNLRPSEKHWKYRPNGWNIIQLVHHCVDSHMNSLIRFKFTLTENQPIIKPYNENKWAELSDSQEEDLTASIQLLKGLHHKWTYLLKNLSDQEFAMSYVHPAQNTIYTLSEATSLYAWHCNHHLAHIKQALASEGKYNEIN